jgi:hypothetical protein
MTKDKLSKYLFIVAMCCIFAGSYPAAKGEGRRIENQPVYIMEFSLGLVFDPLCKYSHYQYKNYTVNTKVAFGLISWSSLLILLGIILLGYRKNR